MRLCLAILWSLGLLLPDLWGQRVDLSNPNQVKNVLGRGNGGTGTGASADDAILVGNGTIWQSKTIPSCLDTAGQHLNYDPSTNSISCGTSGGSGGGAAQQTFSAGATGATVTHTLGATVIWGCYIGTAPNYVPMLVDTVQLNSTTSVFTFAAASGAGKCVVSAGGSGGGGGSGTVTDVGLSAPAIFSVSGSPVTTTGTLALSLATQSANLVWSGPGSGSPATPTFRSLVALDIPSLDAAKITTGTLATARVVSGTITNSRCLHVDSSGNVTVAGADCNTGGGGGGGISTINSEVGPGITLGSDTSGTDVSISTTAANTITWHFPSAGPAERGLVTATNQSFAGDKTFLNRIKFNNPTDPGCSASEYAIYAASSSTDYLKSCVNGTSRVVGNVYSTTGGQTNQLARWTGAGSFRLDDGLAYSQTATANSIAQRSATGGITAAFGSFTQIGVQPTTADPASQFYRGTAGQTANITEWYTQAGVLLSAIDKNGQFTGRTTDQIINVRSYGAVGDCSTNDASAIQAAIDAAQGSSSGVTEVFLDGSCFAISTGLTIGDGVADTGSSAATESTKRQIKLRGQGGMGVDSSSPPKHTGSTRIKWTGSSTAVMLTIQGPMNPGPVLQDITFDANSGSNVTGIKQINVSHSRWDGIAVINAKLGVDMTANARNNIPYGNCDNSYYSLTISTTVTGGSGINMDGLDVGTTTSSDDATYSNRDGHSSCSNFFYSPYVWHDGNTSTAYAVRLAYADSNTFYSPNFYGGDSVSGASHGVWFDSASLSSAHSSFPTANTFHRPVTHQGYSGTTGTGVNALTDKQEGDCYRQCDPNTSLTSGTLPKIISSGGDIKNYATAKFTDGSVSAPTYTFALDTNTGVYRGGSDDLRITTGGTDRLKVSDSVYSMGSLAGFVFHDRSSGLSDAWEWYSDSANSRLYSFLNGRDVINVSATGTTTWQSQQSSGFNVYFREYGNDTAGGGSDTGNRAGLHLMRAGGTIASPTALTSGMRMGTMTMGGYSGTGDVFLTRIDGYVDTVSAGPVYSTSLRFATADASGSVSDAYKIDSKGRLVFMRPYTAAQLSGITGVQWSVVMCSDCTVAATCTGGGSGHLAMYDGSNWTCQ